MGSYSPVNPSNARLCPSNARLCLTTAVSSKFCAVMSRLVRLIGMFCCRCVSSHLTQLKVLQWVIHLLTFCMAVSLPYLLSRPYVLSLTALFRLFLNVLLVCRLQRIWFILLLRMLLRLCMYKKISIFVRLRLQWVRLHGFQPSTFG